MDNRHQPFPELASPRALCSGKQGDRYLRCLLIHGARAIISHSKNLPKKKAQWLADLIERRGKNRATVALANKNVRMMWAIMAHNKPYCTTK